MASPNHLDPPMPASTAGWRVTSETTNSLIEHFAKYNGLSLPENYRGNDRLNWLCYRLHLTGEALGRVLGLCEAADHLLCHARAARARETKPTAFVALICTAVEVSAEEILRQAEIDPERWEAARGAVVPR